MKLPQPMDFSEQFKNAMKDWGRCVIDPEGVKKAEEFIEEKLKENKKVIAHTIEHYMELSENVSYSIYLGIGQYDEQELNLCFIEFHDLMDTYLNYKDKTGNWINLRRCKDISYPFNLRKVYLKTENYYNVKK
ncbi:MAG: hypothetical protein ACFFAN_10700 [Promethearchaeota archaeon]